MNFARTNLFICLIVLLIGTLIGAISCYFFLHQMNEKAISIYFNQILSNEENEAVSRYYEDSPLIGIYAQQRLISSVNNFKNSKIINEENSSNIIGFAEAREAILYESIGELDKAEFHFNKAIETLSEAKINTNKSELRTLFKKDK